MQAESEHHELVEAVHQVEAGMRRIMLQRGADSLADHDITVPQLRLLLEVDDAAPVSPLELAARLHLSASTITGTVDRLVQRGLLSRTEDPRDRRRKQLALTSDGAELVTSFGRSGVSYLLRVLEHLTDDELRDLLRLLGRLAEIDADLAAG